MAGGFVGEDGLEFLSAHRLVRKQEFRHGDEVLLIAREDVLAALVGSVDDGLDLLVDLACHLLGVGPGLGHGAADEHFIVLVA